MAQRTVDIAIVTEGDWARLNDYVSRTQDEIRGLLKGEFRVRFRAISRIFRAIPLGFRYARGRFSFQEKWGRRPTFVSRSGVWESIFRTKRYLFHINKAFFI